MAKKCVYCNAEVDAESVVDICLKCMHSVWGEKMSAAIVEGMQREKAKGNLELFKNSDFDSGNLSVKK